MGGSITNVHVLENIKPKILTRPSGCAAATSMQMQAAPRAGRCSCHHASHSTVIYVQIKQSWLQDILSRASFTLLALPLVAPWGVWRGQPITSQTRARLPTAEMGIKLPSFNSSDELVIASAPKGGSMGPGFHSAPARQRSRLSSGKA